MGRGGLWEVGQEPDSAGELFFCSHKLRCDGSFPGDGGARGSHFRDDAETPSSVLIGWSDWRWVRHLTENEHLRGSMRRVHGRFSTLVTPMVGDCGRQEAACPAPRASATLKQRSAPRTTHRAL